MKIIYKLFYFIQILLFLFGFLISTLLDSINPNIFFNPTIIGIILMLISMISFFYTDAKRKALYKIIISNYLVKKRIVRIRLIIAIYTLSVITNIIIFTISNFISNYDISKVFFKINYYISYQAFFSGMKIYALPILLNDAFCKDFDKYNEFQIIIFNISFWVLLIFLLIPYLLIFLWCYYPNYKKFKNQFQTFLYLFFVVFGYLAKNA